MPDQDLLQVLTGTEWNAGMHHYDYLQSITFLPNGTGSMVYGYAQAVREMADFRYELEDSQKLRFEFLDTTDEDHGKMFQRTDTNAHRVVGFRVSRGLFSIDVPYVGPWQYEYLLEFESEPFPKGHEPTEEILSYYGWRKEPG